MAAALARGMAEAVVYATAAGASRTICVCVERSVPQHVSESGGRSIESLRVTALNDATSGIDSATLNCRKDTLTVSRLPGQTAEAVAIQDVVDATDPDFIVVRL
jgi:hypothetical protein